MNGSVREECQDMEECKEAMVYMWGYIPGASPEKSPILSPVPVRLPEGGVEAWKDVCGGGCGFSMAISETGKLITWGSANDEVQSYLTSGKHGETPEPFPLPTEAAVVKAAAGWAHCVSVTETGGVYTWGWKECVPSETIVHDLVIGGSLQKDTTGKQNSQLNDQSSAKDQHSNMTGGTISHVDKKQMGEEIGKRRKISLVKQESDSYGDDFFTASPCLVNLGDGVRIISVAAGGRHTLALSDVGQVWGWGYGGEGQLGLGIRVKTVATPHIIKCIEQSASGKESMSSSTEVSKVLGSCVKGIACGGRHSAVITDAGRLLTFGWGLHGQCGQGSTDDQLRPTYVSSLSGIQVERVAAGLWHTICISAEGRAYAFGGNQFGQLGTEGDQDESLPKLLEALSLKSKHAKIVSCGARHSAVLTEDGQLFSWGWNKYGQLGLGDSVDRNTPFQVSITGYRPKNVACGWWHTLLLAERPL
ncbi:hypothetical protein I3760_09G197000 [Carya illinoinensis]|uniref:RCC1-like domain-containing protein n=1 Tax=Carya illinoinensis TaxID=32201 RepID=A0A922E6A1_CARIL|nr:hypothetical protein I3760_09G197000 [Carya illinoinensis]KAG6697450.1 hypothetical protein I3842_09G199500 [Carya illinoinensis]